jgi:2-keto-4-pentenoate hydratase
VGRFDERDSVISQVREVATAFVRARREGNAIDRFPGVRPLDLESAYAIQDCALSLWNREVGGWKVGRINPPEDVRLGADRLVGPAFSDTIRMTGEEPQTFRVFHGGFAAAEAEFMLRLAPQAGPPPATAQAAMDWIDEVRIGIEIASSPYAAINIDGPCVTISDHGNNCGLLLGRTIPRADWDRLDAIDVSLAIDGKEVGQATTATMLDGPFGAARFLIGNLAQRGIDLSAGWWISSGAITGVHQVSPGARAVASFAGIGQVTADIA